MVSLQSVSSPTEKAKGKGKSKLNFGPFSPPMKDSSHSKTPLIRRRLALGASPSTVPETPPSKDEEHPPKNETIVLSSSTSVSSFTKTIMKMDIRISSLKEKISYWDNKVGVVSPKRDARPRNPYMERVKHSYGYRGYPINTINIILHSGDPDDIGVAYSMFPNSNFRVPMNDYARKINAKVYQIILKRGETDVLTVDTPQGLGLVNGDKIAVKGVNYKMNTDTRFKQITIKEMVEDHPKQLHLLCPLTWSLYDIHQEWADFSGSDIDSFAFLCKGKPVDRFASVADGEIENGSKMYTVDPAALSPF